MDHGRDHGHGVDDSANARSNALRRRRPPRCALEVGDPDEIEEMRAFGFIELQRPTDGVEDLVRNSACVAALEPGVVLDADIGKEGHLLPPQARHPALSAIQG